MALVMTPIYTQTVGSGGAANITFNYIPQFYTDLKLVYSARNSSTSANLYISINGSTSNFSRTYLYGTGSGVGSARGADNFGFVITTSTDTASTFASGELYIPNYTGSNYKSIISDSVEENNATAATAYLTASLLSNTTAISSITLTANGGNFTQYSTFSLYGIIRAGA